MAQTKLLVVRSITPAVFKDQALRQEVRNALDRTATFMRQAFQKTTQYWETRVEWEEKVSTAGGMASASIQTDSELYYLIDVGAREHVITARRFPTLVWRTDYSAKTAPGELYSTPSSRGDDYRRESSVVHPGFKARDFEGQVEELTEPFFTDQIRIALNNFVRKSGHSFDD